MWHTDGPADTTYLVKSMETQRELRVLGLLWIGGDNDQQLSQPGPEGRDGWWDLEKENCGTLHELERSYPCWEKAMTINRSGKSFPLTDGEKLKRQFQPSKTDVLRDLLQDV